MTAFADILDEYDIAEEIRIERQVHKGSFLLLEGITDIRRFSKFVDHDRCSTVNCFGRPNLVGAIRILYDEGFLGSLGLADADFERLQGVLMEHEGIIYSDAHDFDLDCACEAATELYLAEVGDEEKCKAAGGAIGIRKMVFEATKPLSVLRYINHTQNLRYRLDRIEHHRIMDGTLIDLTKLIDHVSGGRFSAPEYRQSLKERVEGHLSTEFDFGQLTNGHDFCAILGIFLQQHLSDRAIPQTWGREVALHFRLAYSDKDFVGSETFRAIRAWEADNAPYFILRDGL